MMRIPKFHREEGLVHFGEEIYLVPRGDSLVVGATTEPGTWDEGFDREGEAYLGDHLKRFLPGIAAGAVETWAGLRPRTRDRLPWMGWLDASRGWALCAGHYKCGISMAPLAAECMGAILNGEKPPVDLGPFDPWRKKGLTRIS
jgi:glycine oxidase